MKLNERFSLEEYISRDVFTRDGSKSIRYISQALINADLQLVLDLEEHLSRPVSCTINNWKWGGPREYSGLRTPGTPYYKKWSMHSMGAASDKQFKFKDGDREVLPTRVVYDFILSNQARYYKLGIRRMEDISIANTWIHWDTCWTPEQMKNLIQIVG